jgi:hypothetical protein
MHYVALSVGITALVVLVFLAVLALLYFRKHVKRFQHPRETFKRLPSQYSYISPKDTPIFTIPPYVTLEENVFEEGDNSSQGSFKEEFDENKHSPNGSPKATTTALGTTRISRPQLLRSKSEAPPGYTQDRNSYNYRRALSSTLAGTHKKVNKKTSLSPFGKMQVSIHFVTNKNLLVVQVWHSLFLLN